MAVSDGSASIATMPGAAAARPMPHSPHDTVWTARQQRTTPTGSSAAVSSVPAQDASLSGKPVHPWRAGGPIAGTSSSSWSPNIAATYGPSCSVPVQRNDTTVCSAVDGSRCVSSMLQYATRTRPVQAPATSGHLPAGWTRSALPQHLMCSAATTAANSAGAAPRDSAAGGFSPPARPGVSAAVFE